jgi:DNA-binding transcriptional regulator YdaS (Cro superfamily)
MNGIEKAVKKSGNANRLAKMLGVDRGLISYWLEAGYPSPKYCLAINDATGIPLHELHPEVYPKP